MMQQTNYPYGAHEHNLCYNNSVEASARSFQKRRIEDSMKHLTCINSLTSMKFSENVFYSSLFFFFVCFYLVILEVKTLMLIMLEIQE